VGENHKIMARVTESCATLTELTDDLTTIAEQLASIEQILKPLFGDSYSRTGIGLKSRVAAAQLIEQTFDQILDEWVRAVERILILPAGLEVRRAPSTLRDDLAAALRRFVTHLSDPDNLDTYLFLYRHCQSGILARVEPSQFDAIHIALKQVVLDHVRTKFKGRAMEMIRDAFVAVVDERRMMVWSFYIESRERALRASEEKYRSAVDHAPDEMYEIDPESKVIVGANAAAKRLPCPADGEPASPVGRRIVDLVPLEKAESMKKHLHTVLANGSAQFRDLAVGGRYFDVNSALIPFGRQRFIQLILRDVTERREMLDGLLKAERLAAAGILAAGIAHEINNPLASISSLVQSLQTGENDEDRRATLHTILAQISRISSTVKELVDFAHPCSAQQRRAVNLNEVIEDILRLVAYNKRFGEVRLEPRLARNPMTVLVDENEIRQVLLNLLLNAADAVQNGNGLIRIVTENRPCGGQVALLVGDNGIGIPQAHLERVFDPFFTTKLAGSGVGLGLSTCQRIVLANGGTIRIDSQVGQGTTVTVCLPALDERAPTYSA